MNVMETDYVRLGGVNVYQDSLGIIARRRLSLMGHARVEYASVSMALMVQLVKIKNVKTTVLEEVNATMALVYVSTAGRVNSVNSNLV
jgi:hypothetical protein